MKMLEGKKPMSNESILIVLILVLFVFTWYLYANRDKTGGEIAAANYGQVKDLLIGIEQRQNEEKKELEAVANTMATTVGDLTSRIEKLEKKEYKTVNVNLPPLKIEPVQVEVVTRSAPEPLFKGKSLKQMADENSQFKTPLLKKAGIKAKENN